MANEKVNEMRNGFVKIFQLSYLAFALTLMLTLQASQAQAQIVQQCCWVYERSDTSDRNDPYVYQRLTGTSAAMRSVCSNQPRNPSVPHLCAFSWHQQRADNITDKYGRPYIDIDASDDPSGVSCNACITFTYQSDGGGCAGNGDDAGDAPGLTPPGGCLGQMER